MGHFMDIFTQTIQVEDMNVTEITLPLRSLEKEL